VRSADALTFNLVAVRRSDGARVPSSVTVHDPTIVEGSYGDYRSAILLSGFVDRELKAQGAYALQAMGQAFEVLNIVLSSYEDQWEFHFSDDGPVSFRALLELRLMPSK